MYNYLCLKCFSLSVSRLRENGEENETKHIKRQKLELEGENEDATQVSSPRP